MTDDVVMLEFEVRMERRIEDIFNQSISSAIWRFDEENKLIDIITSIRIDSSWH